MGESMMMGGWIFLEFTAWSREKSTLSTTRKFLSVSPDNEHWSAGEKQTVCLQVEDKVGAAGGLLWSTGVMESLGWMLVTGPKATRPRSVHPACPLQLCSPTCSAGHALASGSLRHGEPDPSITWALHITILFAAPPEHLPSAAC